MEQLIEQTQETSLFGLGIDQSSRAHLAQAAKWAKFLAIFGMIVCGLLVILGIFVGTLFSSMPKSFGSEYQKASSFGEGLGIFMIIFYAGFAVLYFFPCLFLLRFANHMRNALNINDQLTLNTSFQNLKIMFRYMGILTIVVISLYILAFLFGILSAASGL